MQTFCRASHPSHQDTRFKSLGFPCIFPGQTALCMPSSTQTVGHFSQARTDDTQHPIERYLHEERFTANNVRLSSEFIAERRVTGVLPDPCFAMPIFRRMRVRNLSRSWPAGRCERNGVEEHRTIRRSGRNEVEANLAGRHHFSNQMISSAINSSISSSSSSLILFLSLSVGCDVWD